MKKKIKKLRKSYTPRKLVQITAKEREEFKNHLRESFREVKLHIEGKIELMNAKDIFE